MPLCLAFLLRIQFTNISSLPVLRQLGVSKEGRELLSNENSLSMIKVWLALEVRQFIHASVQDVSNILSACILFFAFVLNFLQLFVEHNTNADSCSCQVRYAQSKCLDNIECIPAHYGSEYQTNVWVYRVSYTSVAFPTLIER